MGGFGGDNRVLLVDGSSYGTLAAARCFGRHGYDVVLADPDGPTTTRYSRFVRERLRCPGLTDVAALTDWLEDVGRGRPGCLLYPSCDDLAWVTAAGHDRLARHFRMVQPTLAATGTLLDKRRLYALCTELGVPTPVTRYPTDDAQLRALAATLSGRFVVKPRTQVGLRGKVKGTVVEAGPTLVERYQRLRHGLHYEDAAVRRDPSVAWPMLQAFDAGAATRTVSIAGFRSRDGRCFRALAARKVLQYPRTIGVGVCFETITTPPALADHVRRICEAVDHFGAFEVEFVPAGGRHALTDFNPRFYGNLQMEISRGLPTPMLVAAQACGETLDPVPDTRAGRRLANASVVRLVATTQRAAGRITRDERRRWLRLVDGGRPGYVDQVYADDDRRAWLADLVLRHARYGRHPRYAARALFGSA